MGAACPGVPGPSGDKSEIRCYPAASFFVFFFFQSRHSFIEACWVCLAVSRPGRVGSISSILVSLTALVGSQAAWGLSRLVQAVGSVAISRLSDSPRWVSGRVGSISSLVQAIGSVAIFHLSDSPRWVSLSSLGSLGLSSLV